MLHEVHIEKKREQTAGVHGRSSSTNMVPVVLDPIFLWMAETDDPDGSRNNCIGQNRLG